ncbi:MAG: RibD family protein [Hyphomicrobiales bacterium]|nr:RibD family protein [Hyphomicrobiales bacterium]
MKSPAAEALRKIAEADCARPFVVAQLGQSLDGRIATESGESHYINGPAGLDHLHRLRASVDAVVVGAGTIVADDPRLSVRRCVGQNPARVVIDPKGRLGGGKRWLAEDGARRIVVVEEGCAGVLDCERIALPAAGGAIDPRRIVDALYGLGFPRILIEGGARTVSSFLDAGAVDRLHLIVACLIIGSGRPGLALPPLARLADAARPRTDVYRLDDHDLLFDCDLRASRTQHDSMRS